MDTNAKLLGLSY